MSYAERNANTNMQYGLAYVHTCHMLVAIHSGMFSSLPVKQPRLSARSSSSSLHTFIKSTFMSRRYLSLGRSAGWMRLRRGGSEWSMTRSQKSSHSGGLSAMEMKPVQKSDSSASFACAFCSPFRVSRVV